ncbi:hypothetical protein COT40_01535 [Candidatus Peregrinibacteria bacterium CG08_land_8_20_14_0_20_41_10]|nr:MAG: hypothetical protein AUJ78_00145 [Candidatus Peregrinibacteria bacterium CG1_02_41_10]PIS32155.1 MAG: hypothetical protein COT40_01535 [Candidatus Peregrinibacteria bacterium CG08_land_8_20_14_0_20_41_10]
MVSLRTCIGCRQKFPQLELLKITRLKNQTIKIIFPLVKEMGESGRSVYLCPKTGCFDKCFKRKGKDGVEYGLKVKVDDKTRNSILEKIDKTEN